MYFIHCGEVKAGGLPANDVPHIYAYINKKARFASNGEENLVKK
jgi:hypothetical protein